MGLSWWIIMMYSSALCLSVRCVETKLVIDYFINKNVPYLCYLTCGSLQVKHKNLVKKILQNDIRMSVKRIDKNVYDLNTTLRQWNVPIGVLLDGSCDDTEAVLEEASKSVLFDAMHMWLILEKEKWKNDSNIRVENILERMNLSIDADIVISFNTENYIQLMDVFNYGKIQGNNLEKKFIGTWSLGRGLNVSLSRFKYYDRWDLHNLTLRAVTVILEHPKVFKPEMLSEIGFVRGISVMTKVATQLLFLLKEKHNFRFNYTIAGLWVGSPERNSTLAVTNSLFWGEQDISCTCLRIFSPWLNWVDLFFPPTTRLETKFYYLGLDKGVGNYENRFLTPLSSSVWWCTVVGSVACTVVLAVTAILEDREEPGLYAIFSVFAVICQQAYEDGVQLFEEASSSQGRRLILLVVGIMSMLLYNYYTSSVVSWLLNAATPTLSSLDELINSDLELVFEDIGYTRGWLNNPGFFYYSGWKNPKEDVLRTKKVTHVKRTTELLQPAAAGINLIRSGDYAYHTEPYTAYQVISKTFEEKELCALGSLQVMSPAYVYIMGQKRSPYRKFFVWSLMRLLERGHTSAARARVSGYTPTCSGTAPRALSLGQAAPAFAILAQSALLSVVILFCEIYWHRFNMERQLQDNDIANLLLEENEGQEASCCQSIVWKPHIRSYFMELDFANVWPHANLFFVAVTLETSLLRKYKHNGVLKFNILIFLKHKYNAVNSVNDIHNIVKTISNFTKLWLRVSSKSNNPKAHRSQSQDNSNIQPTEILFDNSENGEGKKSATINSIQMRGGLAGLMLENNDNITNLFKVEPRTERVWDRLNILQKMFYLN